VEAALGEAGHSGVQNLGRPVEDGVALGLRHRGRQ